MILLIAGASHTGKTALAQRLLEKYGYPYLSIDHLKMGLIRSGHTGLTPESCDKDLTDYLWPIVREIVKTAVENGQNLIVEGCYIPFDWEKSFEAAYLQHIRYRCLVMSEGYIRSHFEDIRKYASTIEERLDDSYCTMELLLRDNAETLKQCRAHHADYILIDGAYRVDIEL
ncbi:MAG: ATP-binding protein [Oscillospiraceae bacterium]|nr:ATP-binding protein [Oscillospiraceae bacterium]